LDLLKMLRVARASQELAAGGWGCPAGSEIFRLLSMRASSLSLDKVCLEGAFLACLRLAASVREEELSESLACRLLGTSGPPAPKPNKFPCEAERARLFLRAASVPASALRSTCEGRLEVIALKKCFRVPFPGALGGFWGLPPGLAPLGLTPLGLPALGLEPRGMPPP
jgi:hypothetical protein